MNDTCKICGAWEGLHHFETMQCPRNGVEAPVNRKQEWQSTIYQRDDSDDIKAAIAAAVQAEREAIKHDIIDPYVYTLQYGGDRTQSDLRDIASEMDAAIRDRSNNGEG